MIINQNEYYHNMNNIYKTKNINFDNKNLKIIYRKTKNDKAIIWIPGFNDYFYNFYIGNKFVENGYDIYAISLNNYMTNQNENKFNCNSSSEIINSIDKLIEEIINIKLYNNYYLYGHSMGGLIAVNYLEYGKYKNLFKKLILNSPFFDFNLDTITKFILNYIIYYLAYLFPRCELRKKTYVPNYLSLNISKRFYINLNYKTDYLCQIYFSWIKSISTLQYNIFRSRINLKIPIFVLYCDKTTIFENDNMVGDDTLNVEDIDYYSDNIGDNVKKIKVKNSIHDIFSSSIQVINYAFNKTLEWLNF